MSKDPMITIKEQLYHLAEGMKQQHLTDLFAADEDRFNQFSRHYAGVTYDFSKQRIDATVLKALITFANEMALPTWIERLFSEEKINHTEKRAAMHWALRAPKDDAPLPHIAHEVDSALKKMFQLVEKIHSGQYRGVTGEVIQDVVNIGVGGSDLGPLMASYALSDFKVESRKPLAIHFVSTMDGSQLSDILHQLRPETTLFIISSKSFTTVDTLSNAETAKKWLINALGESQSLFKNHFIGVSSNREKMDEWGIDPNHQLPLWEWVGGRYSLWSAIGLPIALTIGVEGFKALLHGGYLMDKHFKEAPFEENLPILMGLIGIWNSNFLDIQTHAILPYDGRLKYFAPYLQQLEMESNGKSTNRQGEAVTTNTCPIIWGEVGPNAQHAFYQLLHQGTHAVSADFIAPIQRYHGNQQNYIENEATLTEQHQLSLANCLAQSRLLAFGAQEATKEEDFLLKFKQYEGNQPSSTLLLNELNPQTLGMLIALYEHKVFVQSVIWGINPFDQWGVEKGKEIAKEILPIVQGDLTQLKTLDASTAGLIQTIIKE